MGSLPIWHLYIYNELKVSRAGCEQGRELGSITTLTDEAYEEIIGADRDLTPRYGWQ